MAHPKSKISKQRKNKRRTHKKATVPQIAVCKTTGEAHYTIELTGLMVVCIIRVKL